MAECPSCHQQVEVLEQHKGTLFNCPHCNAVYFIDWNGTPEVPPPPEEFAPPERAADESRSANEIEASNGGDDAHGTSHDGSDTATSEPAYDGSFGHSEDNASAETVVQDYHSIPADSVESTDDDNHNAESTETAHEQGPYDFSRPLGEVREPISAASDDADSSDLSDVTAFGNSNVTTGQLTYAVRFEGIDSGRIYGQLREALTDARFQWDVPELLKKIENGNLEIRSLNPAKAFILVSRIKYLPLQISWRQDVLAST